MKLNNAKNIRAEDFDEDIQETMGRLGGIVNPFMQEVVELADGRIDFENMVGEIKTVEFTVDDNGKPKLNDKVSTSVSRPRGTIVINDFNITKSGTYPTSAPYMNISVTGDGIFRVNKITGLTPNDKYRLTLIIY